MELPHGHSFYGTCAVYKMNKSISDLKQVSRVWFDKLASLLIGLGFVQTVADYSLFTYIQMEILLSLLWSM